MRGSIKEKLHKLHAKFPKLASLQRNPKLTIALRLEPKPLDSGTLYAYLPTEQSSGIPAHINADFFPESDRKAIILNGNQHQQAWNEQLIQEAATIISQHAVELVGLIGPRNLWFLIDRAHRTHNDKNTLRVFSEYWNQFRANCSNLKIAENTDKEPCLPSELLLPDSKATVEQLKALQTVGCKILSEDLRAYWTVLQKFKARPLNINLLTEVLQQYFSLSGTSEKAITEEDITAVHNPLAEVVNQLMEQSKKLPEGLEHTPFLVTDNSQSASLGNSFVYQGNISSEEILANFKDMKLTGDFLEKHPNIRKFARLLSLDDLINPIGCLSEIEPASFYKTLYEIEKYLQTEPHTYQQLRELQIWISDDTLYQGDEVLIPGGFKDPTGQARLLNTDYFDTEMLGFVREKIGIKTQELDTYICEVLPTIFSDNGPCDPSTYQALINELAKHPTIFDKSETRTVLQSLKIIPTQDGGWAQPGATYHKLPELTKLLGNNKALWFAPERVPTGTQVNNFISNLGVLEKPRPSDLVARLESIAVNTKPTKENAAKSAAVFYQLCDDYDPEKPEYTDTLKTLRQIKCFPARKDQESWHHSYDLYAPFRAEGFESQANILSYSTTAKLNGVVLDKLSIKTNPETALVLGHLKHCMREIEEPHITTYRILNEKSEMDRASIHVELSNKPCIYIKNKKIFYRPNQLYWIEPKLGKYAAKIPEAYSTFRPFFNAIDVKDEPEVEDYVDILCDVIKHRTALDELDPESGKIYNTCLKKIAESIVDDDLAVTVLESLKQLPSVMTTNQKLSYPQDTLLNDSSWHAELFPAEVKNAFCDLPPNLYPLLEHIGVRRLSGTVSTRLGKTIGQRQTEASVQQTLKDKSELILRMFDDENLQSMLQSTLNSFSCFSYDKLTVVAEIRSIAAISQPLERKAYFDHNANSLYISRPFEDHNWVQLFTALFHSLMPASDTTEISKTALSLSPLMYPHISLQDAHLQLDYAGIKHIREVDEQEDILSEEIDVFGGAEEVLATEQLPDDFSDEDLAGDSPSPESVDGIQQDHGTEQASLSQPDSPDTEPDNTSHQKQPVTPDQQTPNQHSNGSSISSTGSSNNWDQYNADNPDRERGERSADHYSSGSSQPGSGGYHPNNPPQQRKRNPGETRKQRNQRFVSYLLPDTEVETRDEESNEVREHNLAIEELAREAVCDYEALRGRLADQMSQTHAGYDIKSIEESGKERFIEVKGIAGEWNRTGVGLSKYQFGQARYHSEQYWLYVVEHVATKNQDIKIYPIQNPSQRVSSFMFDHGWKDIATSEKAKPQQPFVEGARVNAQGWGLGYIRKVEWNGAKKSMIIDFDKRGERRVTYRFGQITIVDEDDEPIDDTFAV